MKSVNPLSGRSLGHAPRISANAWSGLPNPPRNTGRGGNIPVGGDTFQPRVCFMYAEGKTPNLPERKSEKPRKSLSLPRENLNLKDKTNSLWKNMKKRVWMLLISLLGTLPYGYAFSPDSLAATSYHDLKYGEPEACAFDLYLPRSATPVPLVVVVHGGGFTNGDKSELDGYDTIIGNLLKEQIAIASINYRFRRGDDGQGVKRCLDDAVRFIRHIRRHASAYSIDKRRIACIGESAGAGTSLYLGVHDEMARPESSDPYERESTRLACVGALATQATYDLFRWTEFIPGTEAYLQQAQDLLVEFYGFPSLAEFLPVKEQRLKELDMLAMISPDDCPVFVCNRMPGGIPTDLGHLLHHPAHAQVVADYARQNRLETVHYTAADPQEALSRFLIRHLKDKK